MAAPCVLPGDSKKSTSDNCVKWDRVVAGLRIEG